MRRPEITERVRAYQAAGILGISLRTVQALALRGGIPGAAKVGGVWTFDEKALRGWIKRISTPDEAVLASRIDKESQQVRAPATWQPRSVRHSVEECERALRELRRLK